MNKALVVVYFVGNKLRCGEMVFEIEILKR